MKKEHTTKNPLKKLSLQWRLTLIITLLMTVTCVLMYFFISNSAVTGIENLGDYVVKINETDSTPITFNINPNTLFAGLSDQVQTTKDLFRTRSIIATAIIILLSSICTYFISRRALQPLRRLSNEVNKIEAQNLSESLEVPDTNDEISRLTGSFNKMLSRLDDAFTAQKQFSASAAHELRTPLAVMQTNLEVFARKKTPTIEEYQDIFGMIQNQTERLSHLSEVLLDMTGIQSVERSDFISLAELTDEVCCDLASIADQKKVELIQEEGDCTVTGSYLLLYRAVYNLVENAIKYNKENGKVNIWVGNTLNGKKVIVQDTGIGIPKEHQDRIFERFYRVDKSHSRETGGTGLGLSIVKHGALLHNAEIHVESEEEKVKNGAIFIVKTVYNWEIKGIMYRKSYEIL